MNDFKFRNLKNYKYQTLETITLQTDIKPPETIKTKYATLSKYGVLTINSGYAWDGSSGPTWDDDTNYYASLVHDVLYQLMRENRLDIKWFQSANDLFRKILIQDGMGKFRAWYYWKAVSLFGKKYATPKK